MNGARQLSHKDEQILAAQPLQNGRGTGADVVQEAALRKIKKRHRWILCCGCCASTTVIVILVIVILALTVFKAKDPKISVQNVALRQLSYSFNTSTMKVNVNLTVDAAMDLHNPNKASFKYGWSTTYVEYAGSLVGQAVLPPGNVPSDGTAHVNASVTVFADALTGDVQIVRDVVSGSMPMTTRTRIAGRVRILRVFKKHVSVKSACNVTVSLSSKDIHLEKCANKIKL